MRTIFAALLLSLSMSPARADWVAANPGVAAAARDPDVAAVLAETVRVDAALIAGERAPFVTIFAPGAQVNGPANRVNGAAEAAQRFDKGQIAYSAYRRSIEYAGKRANGEVILMGEEAVTPRAPHPLAGKAVRRRFTDIWQKQGELWKLSVRQATVFEAK